MRSAKHLSIPLLVAASLFSAYSVADEFRDTYRAFQTAFNDQNIPISLALGKKAWQLGTKKYGENSDAAAKLHFSYANVLAIAGKDAQAVDHFEMVADEYRTVFGDDSYTTVVAYVDIIYSLAKLDHRAEGRNDLSAELARYLVLNIDEIDYKNTTERAFAHVEAAKAVVESPSAIRVSPHSLRRLFEDAVRYAEEEWGNQDLRTLEAKYMLGVALSEGRQKDEAIAHFNTVASVFRDNLDFTHPYELGAHARLVGLYEQRGESDKATEHCQAIGRMKPWKPDQEPEPLYRVHPKYPPKAARIGREGSVTMSFVVDEEGFVKDIEVKKSSDRDRLFNEYAVDALSQWRYAPKFEEGKPVKSSPYFVQLDFKLER
ncbi:energy transducer TonB [Salinimonas sp. HHU 13199]|uniref:Protein TonB n=1 Tax=Salinimonas profundi TaxID=2729140 RepID=A0ABR8LLA6_9ALTE|nr:energy transducer TonB [Salinimonas profundi]MBD3584724.1 energy transducer TonB [Salinimonas profundi]